MSGVPIQRVVAQVCREVQAGISSEPGLSCARMTLHLGLEVAGDSDDVRVVRIEGAGRSEETQPNGKFASLTLELERSGQAATFTRQNLGTDTAPGTDGRTDPRSSEVGHFAEAETSPDDAMLRRRLELVLGGPPGFSTGARAEILVDLLREHSKESIRRAVEREWASEFDTSLERSPSWTDRPGP